MVELSIKAKPDELEIRRKFKAIASFDLGIHTGWSIIEGTDRLASGTQHHKGKNWESKGMIYLRAERFFRDILTQYKPDLCAFESVRRFMSSDASTTYGGILGQLLQVCEELNIPYVGFSPTELKKHATGKGRASKDEMKAKAQELFNHEPLDDNEADAMIIGHLANKEFGLQNDKE